MILSEQEIIKISNGTPNKEIAMHVACQSQHKADQKDFQKQKQEMWKDMKHNIKTGATNWIPFKHEWGIE